MMISVMKLPLIVIRNEEETLAQRMARLSGKQSKRKNNGEHSSKSSNGKDLQPLAQSTSSKVSSMSGASSAKPTHGLSSSHRVTSAKPMLKKTKYSNAPSHHSFKM